MRPLQQIGYQRETVEISSASPGPRNCEGQLHVCAHRLFVRAQNPVDRRTWRLTAPIRAQRRRSLDLGVHGHRVASALAMPPSATSFAVVRPIVRSVERHRPIERPIAGQRDAAEPPARELSEQLVAIRRRPRGLVRGPRDAPVRGRVRRRLPLLGGAHVGLRGEPPGVRHGGDARSLTGVADALGRHVGEAITPVRAGRRPPLPARIRTLRRC